MRASRGHAKLVAANAHRAPLGGVRVLILVSGLVLAVFLEVMARMLESRQRLAAGYDTSPEAAWAILNATAGSP